MLLSNIIKYRNDTSFLYFMVEVRRLYRIIAPHSALVHFICLRKLTFTLLRGTSAFRFASAYAKSASWIIRVRIAFAFSLLIFVTLKLALKQGYLLRRVSFTLFTSLPLTKQLSIVLFGRVQNSIMR